MGLATVMKTERASPSWFTKTYSPPCKPWSEQWTPWEYNMCVSRIRYHAWRVGSTWWMHTFLLGAWGSWLYLWMHTFLLNAWEGCSMCECTPSYWVSGRVGSTCECTPSYWVLGRVDSSCECMFSYWGRRTSEQKASLSALVGCQVLKVLTRCWKSYFGASNGSS